MGLMKGLTAVFAGFGTGPAGTIAAQQTLNKQNPTEGEKAAVMFSAALGGGLPGLITAQQAFKNH